MSARPIPRVLDPVLDEAPVGFLSFTDDGALVAINTTALRLLGYDREELVGRHVEQLLTVGGRIFYQTHLFPLIRLQGTAEEIFLHLRDRGGGTVGVLLNARRREAQDGIVNDCVFMRVVEREKFEGELLRARRAAEQARAEADDRGEELRLVNDQLEAQALELELQHQQLVEQAEALHAVNAELEAQAEELSRQRVIADEASRAKSTFLAVMSHELRTPLNAIGGYVQLLEMGIHGPVSPAQTETLGRVARAQKHLLRLIDDVLNLAKIEAGVVEYMVEEVPLAELVGAVVPLVEPQAAAKGISVEVEVSADAGARADREKAEQILLNLLGNAVKFTPEGGHVRVDEGAPAADSGSVCLRVSDTGIGIPAEMLRSVFEPFVQVDAGHTRGAQGTGLGLSISRDMARGMGGDLVATSVEGCGSVFTLQLPAGSGSLLRGSATRT